MDRATTQQNFLLTQLNSGPTKFQPKTLLRAYFISKALNYLLTFNRLINSNPILCLMRLKCTTCWESPCTFKLIDDSRYKP